MQNPDLGPYGLQSLFAQADAVGIATMLLLLAMSIASWYVILSRSLAWLVLRRRAAATLDAFRRSPDLAHAQRLIAADTPDDPYADLARAGLCAARDHARAGAGSGSGVPLAEHVTLALRRALDEVSVRLESGLTVLASVGSVAPFVGLFGTVWKIYHALVAIGFSGQASLDQIAAPVGAALLMTAAGLAVAVPAVLAYNGFVRMNRVLLSRLDGYAHDLHGLLVYGDRATPSAATDPAREPDAPPAAPLAHGAR